MPYDNKWANYRKAVKIKDALDLAADFTNDPEKETRIAEQKCMPCHYILYMAGQAFTPWECKICNAKDIHSNTHTPTLCMDCAKKENVCHMCGADI